MSIRLTGTKERPINVLQNRLDNFFHSCRSYEQIRTKLVELAAQSFELSDIPAREELIQDLLFQYKETAEKLKANTEKVQAKTDKKHIKKIFQIQRWSLV